MLQGDASSASLDGLLADVSSQGEEGETLFLDEAPPSESTEDGPSPWDDTFQFALADLLSTEEAESADADDVPPSETSDTPDSSEEPDDSETPDTETPAEDDGDSTEDDGDSSEDDDGSGGGDVSRGSGWDLPFVTVQFEEIDSSDTFNLIVQLRDPSGDPVGDEEQANADPIEGVQDAEAVLLSSGFVVAWQSYDSDTDQSQVFYRIYDDSGEPVGDVQAFDGPLPEGEGDLRLEREGSGFRISWIGNGPDGVPFGSGVSQVFDADGGGVAPPPDLAGTDGEGDGGSDDGGDDVASGDLEFRILPVEYLDDQFLI